MKKFLLILLILLLGFGGYVVYDNYFKDKGIPKLETEEETIKLDEIYIFGKHLNMHGNLVDTENLDLILYNGEFINYDINISDDGFNISDYVNDGINLENIPRGTYYLFLRNTSKDEEDKDVYKYYQIQNDTKYEETIYYSFSNVNNKIVITNETEEYNTLKLIVNENKDANIYDVVIDPGHGGLDSGANKYGYREADLTMKLATSLKEKMEELGIKVKLTRTEGQLSLEEKMDDYGTNARAVISHEVNAKYLFSLHLNSNNVASVNGLEIYTPSKINYEFANSLAKNIVENTNTNYSTSRINRVGNGVYTRTFTDSEITESNNNYENKGLKPYDITNNSNYYFMIRESGSIVTGAYVDDRNFDVNPGNPYCYSNVGVEAYLLELAYLTNKNDLDNINENMDKYTESIANTFNSIFENNLEKVSN